MVDDDVTKIDDDYDNNKPYTFKLLSHFKKLYCSASFQKKLCNVMGSSIESSHGLINPNNCLSTLTALERGLDNANKKFCFESDSVVNIYYPFVILSICLFALLPQTLIEDQTKYMIKVFFFFCY